MLAGVMENYDDNRNYDSDVFADPQTAPSVDVVVFACTYCVHMHTIHVPIVVINVVFIFIRSYNIRCRYTYYRHCGLINVLPLPQFPISDGWKLFHILTFIRLNL